MPFPAAGVVLGMGFRGVQRGVCLEGGLWWPLETCDQSGVVKERRKLTINGTGKHNLDHSAGSHGEENWMAGSSLEDRVMRGHCSLCNCWYWE